MNKKKIGVIIVTYNRIEKLKNTLSFYDKLTIYPNFIIVYNNGSTDDTKTFLKTWQMEKREYKKYVFSNNVNAGGSGGFYNAIAIAFKFDYDWLWISDDDAYPQKNVFEILNKKIQFIDENVGVICSSVFEHGNYSGVHRAMKSKNPFKVSCPSTIKDFQKEEFEINFFSYVGTAIRKDALLLAGLPKKNYFIYCDDGEHSMRINKYYKIIVVPSIIMIHDCDLSNDTLSWKSYYGFRNQLDQVYNNFSFFRYICYVIKYKLSFFKYFFTNRKKYYVKKDAYNDFKRKKFGISNKYKPGIKL